MHTRALPFRPSASTEACHPPLYLSRCSLSLHLGLSVSLSLSAVRDCACAVSDHGPINSWDRNAFISDVKYGTPSYTSAMNHVVKKKNHVAFPSRCMHAVQTL